MKKCFLIEAYIPGVRGWREKVFNIIHRCFVCASARRWWNVVTFGSSKSRSAESFVSTRDALLSGFSRSSHDDVNDSETKPKKRRLHCVLVPIFIVIHSTSDVKKDLNQTTLFAVFSACALNELYAKHISGWKYFTMFTVSHRKKNAFPEFTSWQCQSTSCGLRTSSVNGKKMRYGWNQDIIIFCIRLKTQSGNNKNRLIFRCFGVRCASGWIMSLCDFQQNGRSGSELLMFFHRIFMYA